VSYQILLKQIQASAIDSEGQPISPEEVEPVANALIQRLVLNLPDFQAQAQEELDQLRFNDQIEEPSSEEFSVPIPGDSDYADPFGEHWSCA